MIKSDDNPTIGSAKQPKCWHREANSPAVRIELWDGEVFLFPYHHLTFAHLTSESGSEVLTISFASHDATIRGRSLLPVLKALQDSSLEWVGVLAKRYAALQQDDGVAITEIDVRLAEDANA